MEEQASFETRAVLAPRRTRLSRFALLVPVGALVAIVWAGASGKPSEPAPAGTPGPWVFAAPTAVVSEPASVPPSVGPRPAEAVGLEVQHLDDVLSQELGRDDVFAITGWYVATAITDCPEVVVIHIDASLPEIRRDFDEKAFCERDGLLYAAYPEPMDGRTREAGLPAVGVSLVMGVVVPDELETIGGATEVVVIGRFVPSGDGCEAPAGCRQELIVDHVAWTSGA